MANSLHALMAETRLPPGDPPLAGGVEAACAAGLIADAATLRSFLYGRLWTAGAVDAFAAAAVCARARSQEVPASLWRSVEAELEARIPSPEARRASRRQGGHTLRLAMAIRIHPVFDALARATVSHGQQPHFPVVLGAVAAVAGATPEEAAESAAYASVAPPAFAAQRILRLEPVVVSELGVGMAPEVARLAREAAQLCQYSLSDMPSFAAPALEYLAEDQTRTQEAARAG